MKLARTTKDYGGGQAVVTFQSNIFTVRVWYLSKGTKTTITSYLDEPHWVIEIPFDGEHNFSSDEECLEQMTPTEILKLINSQKKTAHNLGLEDKAREIRQALGIVVS